MRCRLVTSRHSPSVRIVGIVWAIEEFLQRFPKVRARFRKDIGKIGERCDATFERRLVADVQDHSGTDGSRGILPIALLRAVLAGTDDHVGDILGVAHVTWSEEADFGERIKPGTAGLLNWRKLE